MEINGVPIDNTYAEAFPTWISRVIITAVTEEWAYNAAVEATVPFVPMPASVNPRCNG